MFLEKIKENAGKISFFVISFLLVVIGVLFFNQKNQVVQTKTTNQQGSNYASTGSTATTTTIKTPVVTKVPISTSKVS